MRRGLNSQAYTIVEVIIFLAVSSALLVSALLFVGGQQRKTEFYQSIHDIEQQINDVMNNVSTGYYAKTTGFNCGINGTDLDFLEGSAAQGANQGCLFIGRAIQFSVGGDGKNFNVYNLVGKQYSSGTTEVNSLQEARPKALATSPADNTENRILKYGLNVVSMDYDSTIPTSVVAFVTDFAQPGTGVSVGGLESGSRTAKLYAIVGTTLNSSKDDAVAKIDDPGSINAGAVNIKEASSVKICFASGGTNQSGLITIGGENRQLSTKLEIFYNNNCGVAP